MFQNFCTEFWMSAPKIVDVCTNKCVCVYVCVCVCFLPPWWCGYTFDPRASGRRGQECPREVRTKKFRFMLFLLPWYREKERGRRLVWFDLQPDVQGKRRVRARTRINSSQVILSRNHCQAKSPKFCVIMGRFACQIDQKSFRHQIKRVIQECVPSKMLVYAHVNHSRRTLVCNAGEILWAALNFLSEYTLPNRRKCV